MPVPTPWTPGGIASGAMVGARVNNLNQQESRNPQPTKWWRYQHSVYRSTDKTSSENLPWERLACHLMQLSQNRLNRDYEYAPTHSVTTTRKRNTKQHCVQLPRFTFMLKDYEGRRVTVKPILSHSSSKKGATVEGYTFYTELVFCDSSFEKYKESLHDILQDMRNDRLRDDIHSHLESPSAWEHLLNFLGKATAVSVCGSAVLFIVVYATGGLATALALSTGVTAAVVSACVLSTVFPPVAIVAGIALLWWIIR